MIDDVLWLPAKGGHFDTLNFAQLVLFDCLMGFSAFFPQL
jgi:hypothetical protein